MMAFNQKAKTGLWSLASVLTLLSLLNCGGSGGDITLTGNDNQATDPVVVEVPIAYIKRVTPDPDAADPFVSDLRDPLAFNPGTQLFVRARASSSSPEINVSDQMLAIAATEEGVDVSELAIDIKDLETNFDGTTLLFAARIVVEPIDDNLENSTWNLWEYDFASNTARYVIDSATIRNEAAADGASQDIAPHYLPDGRIVFSSTRQVNSLTRLTAEGRPSYIAADESRNGPATVLHILDPDDNSFQQISFNPSHDLEPMVLQSGEVVFSRWDNGPGNNRLSLYKINPSGRQLSRLYGYHSNDSGSDPTMEVEFSQPREMEDGRLMTILRTNQSDTLGGDIVMIDTQGYVDHDQPIWANQGSTGIGQTSLTPTAILINDPLSPGGQYSAAFPLHDGTNRILVSWSQCRALNGDLTVPCSIAPSDATAASAFYGLWIYNPQEDTQLPIINPEEGFIYTEIVAAESRRFPAVPNDGGPEVFDSDLVDSAAVGEGFGLLRIDSVYDFDGIDNSDFDGVNDSDDVGIGTRANPANTEYTNRPARFIRLVKPVLFPDPDNDNFDIPNEAFGRSGAQGMREILGYAPIEPDGSVTVTVPANTPFTLSILDANGRRISQRHNVWMQVGPGEIKQCAGCHANNSDLPHGRIDSQPPSTNAGAQSLVVGSGTGIGFPNTPVDRNDYPLLFLDGADVGQTMAEIFDLQRPLNNKPRAFRDIELDPSYQDEWADTVNGQTADPSLDYAYDTGWIAYPTRTNGLAPYVNRLVINYVDHIQPIWERTGRTMENGGVQVNDRNGAPADSCVSCHRSNPANAIAEIEVPAGQLDLTDHIDNTYYRSYRELMFNDTERWLDSNGNAADRIRTCTEEQSDGMGGTITVPIADPNPPTIDASMNTAGANSSNAFFNCFDTGNNCGVFVQQATPPINCVEDGTIVTDPLPYNHAGWLTDGELRLLSEWLDIGGQYYNDPFHSDIFPP